MLLISSEDKQSEPSLPDSAGCQIPPYIQYVVLKFTPLWSLDRGEAVKLKMAHK